MRCLGVVEASLAAFILCRLVLGPPEMSADSGDPGEWLPLADAPMLFGSRALGHRSLCRSRRSLLALECWLKSTSLIISSLLPIADRGVLGGVLGGVVRGVLTDGLGTAVREGVDALGAAEVCGAAARRRGGVLAALGPEPPLEHCHCARRFI